jgi:serine/threonine-protein kinase
MDLLEGIDLEGLLRERGRLDEATLIDIMVPVVAGLAAVHDAGVVHRDLKPSNIFLVRGRDAEVEPRLLDFGISKSLDADALKLTAAHGLLLGTPFYMAPEGVHGSEMTPLSDQYSLGVVLYECATGVNPFAEASDLGDVVKRVGLGEWPAVASRNPAISPRLAAVIERAMQLDPARRFPDVRALGSELLLLAGQRTRVTWNLNFTVLAARGLCARAATASSEPSVGALPRSGRSRLRLLPWAAAGIAALSLSGAKSPGETSPAPRSADVATVQSALQSFAGKIQVRGVAPHHAAGDPAPLAATQAASGSGTRDGGAPPKPVPLHPPVSARPAAPAAQRAHSGGLRAPHGTQYGTNHAPIFE